MGSVLSALEAIAEAAQAVIANKAEDVDPRLDYVIVQPDRDEWEALTEAVDEWIELTGRDHNQ